MWVIGGDTAPYAEGNTPNNDVYYSTDGANWTQATASADFPARAGHRVVVYADKMWLTGGYDGSNGVYGDVWYSSDGVDWTQVQGENLPPRWAFGFQSWKGKMWVIGGFTGTTPAYSQTMYYSSDGVTWTNAGDADWSARGAFGSAIYANKLWVFGGNTDSGYASDTWQTHDGVTWVRESEDNSWAARVNNNVGVVMDRLWFMGGYSSEAPNYRNDVYKSKDIKVPVFASIPGGTAQINIEEGQVITEKYVTINVYPTDNIQIQKVEFYVDGVLIGTDTDADGSGVYSAVWDASKYHSDIRVVAYDINGNTTELTRTAEVDPSVYATSLPTTGEGVLYAILFVAFLVIALEISKKRRANRLS